MKKTKILKLIKDCLPLMIYHADQEERGVDGLGNGPGLINGYVHDKKARDKFLKSSKQCKDPYKQLTTYLEMIKCDVTKAILEEESE